VSPANVLPFRSVTTPKASERFETCVPLTSLRAVADRFNEEQSEFDDLARWASAWITWDNHPHFEPGMFVARVQGESMEPEIPDGAYCLFRAPQDGSRQGKRLVVWHSAIDDPATSGPYTLKVYTSEKEGPSEGLGHRPKILLQPVNPEFEPIVLTPENEEDVRVIAELHTIL
jgi:peptidase S24-like protein